MSSTKVHKQQLMKVLFRNYEFIFTRSSGTAPHRLLVYSRIDQVKFVEDSL